MTQATKPPQACRWERALVAARDATQIATERYDRDLTDFPNVLDAERQQFDLDARLLTPGEIH